MKVIELMDTEFPLLNPKQTIIMALNLMVDWEVPSAPVADAGHYLGVFSLNTQILKKLLKDRNGESLPLIGDIMNTGIPFAREEQSIEDVDITDCPIIPVVTKEGLISGILWVHKIAAFKAGHTSRNRIEFQAINDILNTIIHSSLDGIMITDGEGVILRVNRAEEGILGYTAQELVGKNVRLLVDLGIIIRSVTEEALSTQKPATTKQTAASGSDYIAIATPIFNQDGRIYRVVTLVRDISEIVELQEALDDNRALALESASDQAIKRSRKMLENGIVSKSPAMLKVVDLALKVAQFAATVLILGESGVGKELIAKLIHNTSERVKSGQFIKVNCGAIPRELLESEFFGYEPGAFTGAKKEGKPGYFELAHQGTLFLDEIGELPLELQVKLLRVIQERELVRLGDTRARKIDVRIIAATNRELEQMVSNGTFREDLFYRLNVLPLQIPPLRSRPEDIPALLTAFLENYSRKYGTGKMFSGDSMTMLCRYSWPGNVRELENVVERLVITADEPIILPHHLPLQIYQVEEPDVKSRQTEQYSESTFVYEPGTEMRTLQEVIDEVEKDMINKALQIYGSTYRAAKVLGVSQSTIVRKAKKYHQKNERFWYDEGN